MAPKSSSTIDINNFFINGDSLEQKSLRPWRQCKLNSVHAVSCPPLSMAPREGGGGGGGSEKRVKTRSASIVVHSSSHVKELSGKGKSYYPWVLYHFWPDDGFWNLGQSHNLQNCKAGRPLDGAPPLRARAWDLLSHI